MKLGRVDAEEEAAVPVGALLSSPPPMEAEDAAANAMLANMPKVYDERAGSTELRGVELYPNVGFYWASQHVNGEYTNIYKVHCASGMVPATTNIFRKLAELNPLHVQDNHFRRGPGELLMCYAKEWGQNRLAAYDEVTKSIFAAAPESTKAAKEMARPDDYGLSIYAGNTPTRGSAAFFSQQP